MPYPRPCPYCNKGSYSNGEALQKHVEACPIRKQTLGFKRDLTNAFVNPKRDYVDTFVDKYPKLSVKPSNAEEALYKMLAETAPFIRDPNLSSLVREGSEATDFTNTMRAVMYALKVSISDPPAWRVFIQDFAASLNRKGLLANSNVDKFTEYAYAYMNFA